MTVEPPFPGSLEWNDLAVILAICRAGSLSGAARTLGHNHSTVFRRITAIERKTGVRFFERLRSGYAMTEAGEAALRYGERIETEIHGLEREILGRDSRLQGKIRLTAPNFLSVHWLPAMIADFRHRQPGVSVDVVGTSESLDLARREADIAIRATTQPPDASLARRICDFRFCIYASPDYLARHPDKPLPEHDWVNLHEAPKWLVPFIWDSRLKLERSTVFSSPSATAVLKAAEAGMGLMLTSCYMGDSSPLLVPVVAPIEAFTIELWVLTHPDLRHTARVKVMMSYLVERLRADRDKFEGRKALEFGNYAFSEDPEPKTRKTTKTKQRPTRKP